MRIVLIGCTGVGKSSLGNTLLGVELFDDSPGANSVTFECGMGEQIIGKRNIKVADTPGIINTDGKNMGSVLKKFFNFLAPGPHAIIIVIAPGRGNSMERQAIEGLREFFGDDHFLDFTMLVMVRKSEIVDNSKRLINIHEFIANQSTESVKQLYKKCKKRIVAVENKEDMTERQKDAEMVFKEIDKMDGYYPHRYFKILSVVQKKDETIAVLKQRIKDLECIKTKEQENEELKNKITEKESEKGKCTLM